MREFPPCVRCAPAEFETWAAGRPARETESAPLCPFHEAAKRTAEKHARRLLRETARRNPTFSSRVARMRAEEE